MNEILIKILQLLLSISILVLIHELGHFLFARLFKIRVEKFYIFFNPWFSLFKKKIGDTEYGIGWLPLGGYVKISGMIDESYDKKFLNEPPKPYEFRSKPPFQRLIVLLGGIFFNIILAISIFSLLLLFKGEKYLPNDSLKYGIMTNHIGESIGLKNGDFILSINNKPIDNFNDIVLSLVLDKTTFIKVKRDTQILYIPITNKIKSEIIKNPFFIEPRIPFIIDSLLENSPAKIAGLKPGDQIIKINDTTTFFFDEVKSFLENKKNQKVKITILRNNKDTLNFYVNVNKEGKIGVIALFNYEKFFKLNTIKYNILTCIPAGISKTYRISINYLKQFKLLFMPEIKAYESVGGFISIGKIFPKKWDWESFFTITGFLSVILAIMNFLPIPGLDGGHTLFVLYEIITGKQPSPKFLEYAQTIGLAIILLIILYANINDIIKLFN